MIVFLLISTNCSTCIDDFRFLREDLRRKKETVRVYYGLLLLQLLRMQLLLRVLLKMTGIAQLLNTIRAIRFYRCCMLNIVVTIVV